jgi:hypothetical protein
MPFGKMILFPKGYPFVDFGTHATARRAEGENMDNVGNVIMWGM